MAKEIAFLTTIEAFNKNAVRAVSDFICSPDMSDLAKRYQVALQKRNPDIGFNLFELISDYYYRETFHTHILHALLDPTGKHNEKNKYLRLFLAFICAQKAKVNLTDYENAEVVEEQEKIDILILDQKSKNAIIIENKINDAVDQEKQLPRYLEDVTASGYRCDAIIYLRLHGYTDPDSRGWTDDEWKRVKALLTIVCAYNGNDEDENDLLKGWIFKCEYLSNNLDAKHILRQYGALLKKLGGNIMNKPIMEDFYKIILQDKNLTTALSLKAMVEELVLFRVEKIINTFRSDLTPFRKLGNCGNDDAIFENLLWGDAHLSIDIEVYQESYSFCFWDRNDGEAVKALARTILQKMNCLDEYISNSGMFVKTFKFPSQEDELFDHIRAFKKNLAAALAEK